MKYTLACMIGLFGLTTFAQDNEQVIIVKREPNTRYSKPRKQELDINNYNAFKFDPLRMAIGEINFSWEHRMDDHTTFELEAGPTISNLGSGRYYVSNNNSSTDYQVHSGMGGLISAAVRYYPLENSRAMNKLYISPRIKYRVYNESYSSGLSGVSDKSAKSGEFIFSFNLGYQQWVSHNFAFDYYIGMGIGSFKGNRYVLEQFYDGNSNTWTYGWNEETAQYARVVGVIGLKVTVGN